MHLKKLFSLALVVLMLLSLWACGKQDDEYKSDTDATEPQTKLLPDEAGKLTIYCETDLQIVYNDSGKVIAVTALNEPAEDIASSYEFAEKDCSLAALELIDQILDQNPPLSKGFILIRQELGSATPGDDFLKKLQGNAQLNKGGCEVIVVAADELDQDGLFSKEIALTVLKTSSPAVEGSTLSCSDTPTGGSYTITCTDAEGNVTQYSVGAVDGSVIQLETAEETEPESTTDEETTPESDIFDPIPDTESNQGTDGGMDDGSVEFS